MKPARTPPNADMLTLEKEKARFCLHLQEFSRVMADIRSTAAGSSMQHYIFTAATGGGKTTMLRRIEAEILTDILLGRRLAVVRLPEEQAGMFQLHDLWGWVAEELSSQGISVQQMDWREEHAFGQEYVKRMFEFVRSALDHHGKQLVLLIDNIDKLLDHIGEEAGLFREQLMNHPLVRIIGTSRDYPVFTERYSHPFFQFFLVKQLPPASLEDVQRLWQAAIGGHSAGKLDKIFRGRKGLVETALCLTNASSRAAIALGNNLLHFPGASAHDLILRLMDDVKYPMRNVLEGVSYQQQRIVVELAFFWEAATVEQLITACRISGKIISAQLNALADKGVVEKLPGQKRGMSYRLVDRHFNMWLIATQGGPIESANFQYLTNWLERIKNARFSLKPMPTGAIGRRWLKWMQEGQMEAFWMDFQKVASRWQALDCSRQDACMQVLLAGKQYHLASELLDKTGWHCGIQRNLNRWIGELLQSGNADSLHLLPEELLFAAKAGANHVAQLRKAAGIPG